MLNNGNHHLPGRICVSCKRESSRLISALTQGRQLAYFCPKCWEVMVREEEEREKA